MRSRSKLRRKPKMGLEPITPALRKRCSAIELLRHCGVDHIGPSGQEHNNAADVCKMIAWSFLRGVRPGYLPVALHATHAAATTIATTITPIVTCLSRLGQIALFTIDRTVGRSVSSAGASAAYAPDIRAVIAT